METPEISKFDSKEVIAKIEEFEVKKELNKFFLIMFIAGYIGVISSFIEYFFHSFYNLDVTFYILQDIGSLSDLSLSNQPFLFVIVWSLHLLPLIGVFFYTSERTGVIDFTKSYRKIAIICVSLFALAEFSVFLFARNNYRLIPVVWGLLICIGLIFTGLIFYNDFNIRIIAWTMFISSLLTILEVIIVFIFIKDDFIGPSVITYSIGMMLIFMSIIVYFLKQQNRIAVPLKSLKLFNDRPGDQNATVIRNLELINNHLKNTLGISESELFDYMNDARKILSKSAS